ncbi:MAG: hypothetical protein WCQ72_08410 [Eubacteriales bacterium]
MNKMRITALAMALVLSAASFVSCGSTPAVDTTASETTTAAPETTTAAPETTTAETTTKKQIEYEYTSVAKWDYTTMEDGAELPFTKNADISDLKVEGGSLVIVSTGGDPYITYKGSPELDADSIQEIVITGSDGSSNDAFQLFFTNADNPNYSEEGSLRESWEVTEDLTAVNEIHLDTSFSSVWTGTVTGMRIDPLSDAGEVHIQSIEFFTVTVKE